MISFTPSSTSNFSTPGQYFYVLITHPTIHILLFLLITWSVYSSDQSILKVAINWDGNSIRLGRKNTTNIPILNPKDKNYNTA